MGYLKKKKLAYRITGIYLCNAIAVAVIIMVLAGAGIHAIEKNVVRQYQNNLTQYMDYLDEELVQLREILWFTMQGEHITLLQERYLQMTTYDRVDRIKRAREELAALDSQYRWIADIGIYLSVPDRWISVSGTEVLLEAETRGLLLEEDGSIFLKEKYEKKGKFVVGYVKIDKEEFAKLQNRIRFDDKTLLQMSVQGRQVTEAGIPEKQMRFYQPIHALSKLFPIEATIYVSRFTMVQSGYLIWIGGISVLILMVMAVMFARYLTKAIHVPLENILSQMEGINEESFETELVHKGVDEFTYVTSGFNKMKNMLEAYIKTKYEQEIIMKQMELDHLQSQVKPHFLYNCFFNIENLCKTYDLDKVEQLSRALARYYRYITRTSQQLVTLESEYEHMRNYLTVQNIRFSDRVEISVEKLSPESGKTMVPRLVLQPIVENAYKYVFETIDSGGKLVITVKDLNLEDGGDAVRIRIEDNGSGITPQACGKMMERFDNPEGPITGLVNINRRLKYKNQSNRLVLSKSELGGLCVDVLIHKDTGKVKRDV